MNANCGFDSERKILSLSNGLVSREFSCNQGFKTINLQFAPDGRNLVDPRHKMGIHDETIEKTEPCREAMIGINGQRINLGTDGDFSYVSHETLEGDDNDITLAVLLKNNSGIEVKLNYQIFENQAFIVKWVEVSNKMEEEILISSCQPEVLTMPGGGTLRWHECTRKVYPACHVINSTRRPFTYWTYNYSSPENQPMIWVDHFTSKSEKYGFAISNNYIRRCYAEGFETAGKEEKLPEMPGVICSCGHSLPGEIHTQFPVGPDVKLKTNEKFVSFKTYMVFFEGDYEDGGLALRKMTRRICPWTNDFDTRFEHTYWTKSISEKIRETQKFDMSLLKHSIDQAAELGFDRWYFSLTFWAQSFGEFLTRPEFVDGVKNMREVSDYAHSKGLKVAIHTPEDYGVDFPDHYLLDEETGIVSSYDIGVPGDFLKRNPQYLLRDINGKQARGWVMCGASGFHQHLLDVKIPFLKALGIDVVDNDGCYYGDMCHSQEHGHNSPAESQYQNWRLAVKRYQAYIDAGLQVVAPDGAQSFYNGNSSTPTYHTETSTRHDVYEFIKDMRTCLYKSSYYIPNTALTYAVWCDPAVMNGVDVASDEKLLDHYFASISAYGVNIGMMGMEVYSNETVRGTVKKWIDFMKRHHEILQADVIHLVEPTGKDLDIIMHSAPGSDVCGLLAAFNPTGRNLCRDVLVARKYLGTKAVLVKDALMDVSESARVDEENDSFVFDLLVPARGYSLVELKSTD